MATSQAFLTEAIDRHGLSLAAAQRIVTDDDIETAERIRIHRHDFPPGPNGLPPVYADEDGARRDEALIRQAWADARASGEPAFVTRGKVHEAAERLYMAGMVAAHRQQQGSPATRQHHALTLGAGWCYLGGAIGTGARVRGWHEPYAYTGETDPMDETGTTGA